METRLTAGSRWGLTIAGCKGYRGLGERVSWFAQCDVCVCVGDTVSAGGCEDQLLQVCLCAGRGLKQQDPAAH